jgi:hypothetical protein
VHCPPKLILSFKNLKTFSQILQENREGYNKSKNPKTTSYNNYPISPSKMKYINKIQQDATVCRYLFTANLLYMFRVSIAPIIRDT